MWDRRLVCGLMQSDGSLDGLLAAVDLVHVGVVLFKVDWHVAGSVRTPAVLPVAWPSRTLCLLYGWPCCRRTAPRLAVVLARCLCRLVRGLVYMQVYGDWARDAVGRLAPGLTAVFTP